MHWLLLLLLLLLLTLLTLLLLLQVRWEANVKNGVCAVQFDRKDIEMNKFGVGCLEAQFHVFDARTQHPKKVRRAAAWAQGLHRLPPANSMSWCLCGALWTVEWPTHCQQRPARS